MANSRVIYKSYHSMNSVLDIVLTDVQKDLAEIVCAQINQLAQEYEDILSCHNPGAEVFQLNQHALTGYTVVSQSLLSILLECKYYHTITKGYFDVGLKKFKLSTNKKVSDTLFGMNGIEINKEKQTVKFWSEYSSLDLGGIGKGILLREAEKVLSRYNITNCFVSFGGSSILTKGTHPHGVGWPVSLREEADYTFYLNDHAASFSESHPAGSKTSHIIHTGNLLPVNTYRMTFAQALCPVLTEVLSTALVNAPVDEASEIVSVTQPIKAFIFSKSDQHNLSIEYQYGN